LAANDSAEKKQLFERLASVREIVFGVQDGVLTTAGVLCGLGGAMLGNAALDGVVMGLAFLVGALVPLLPYMLIPAPRFDLGSALATTALTLFGVGYFEGWLAHRTSRWRSGMRFLAIAMSAAAAGYLIGLAISPLGATAG
jgi:VIT1/CCC1 family predicted Fe2+/Mn2+ transporter